MYRRSPALTRRGLLGGTGSVAVAAMISSCGGGAGGGGDDEVSLLNWEQVKGTPLEEAIRTYEEESGEQVDIQPVPTSDYDTKMRTVISAGTAPDIMRINDDFVRGFSDEGALLDLSTYIEEDQVDTRQFATEVFEFPLQADGTHTGWVLGHQPRLIFYNVDAFEDAGAPLPPREWTAEDWTWDDFVERAQTLTVPGERYGALIYLDTGYEQTFTVNHGSKTGIFSEDGTEFTLAGDAEVEALQWAVDLTCQHEVQPPWSELQQDNADAQMFAQGKLAMMFATFGTVPYLRDTVKDFRWDVAPPPGDVEQKTESSVIVFTIPESATNPDRAWNLLKFLSSEEGGTILAKGGAFTPINLAAADKIDTGEGPENILLFAEAANHLTATNQTRNTLGARELYRPALDAAYNCERPVGEVLEEIKPQVESALAG